MKLTGPNALAKGAALPSMFPFDFGGYRVLSLLGRGGMGAVYEAEQRETGRRVALKVLGHDLDSEDMRKRFLREGRLAAAVTHPNSIYIFGTEEIEGAPVIVMEIAGGGTLKDELKKRGPLPVKEAVDAMLQIIAGLEAAHAGGVLHRDVKPANCFLAPDGTAKVGDFGLSVSTLARTDTQLTASGMMLGTPSFAPPEQLRGDELDLRADIYSVGATLYTLLTGRAPFDGENAVQVVAAVLDKAPKPVSEFRKDVASGLAEVIARCMSKKREARLADYAALREALLPFSSQVPEPAPLGLRFAAGLVDDFIASLPELVLGVLVVSAVSEDLFLSERTWASFLPWFSGWICYRAYFIITEGVWGAGIGKALCGLRVIRPNGDGPGIWRTLVRTLVYDFASLGVLLPLALTSGAEYEELLKMDAYLSTWWFWLPIIGFFGLFVTMRRSNGFAAVQDLISGTRVVRRVKADVRPRVETNETKDEVPANGKHIGPYVVIKPLSDTCLLAHDPALRRDVWIDRDANEISEARRDIARPGRLRWLGGTVEWNAFEAPGGQALSAFEKQSQPWATVRCWLADIAAELIAAEKDGTLPASLSIEQVWITRGGRAVLLDDKERRFANAAPCEQTQSLLDAMSKHALDPKTVPLHAQDVLKKFTTASFDRMSFIAGNLQSLLVKPATVTMRRRAASLLVLPAAIAVMGAGGRWMGEYQEADADAQWQQRFPDQPPLSAVMRLRTASDHNSGMIFAWRTDFAMTQAIDIHLAAHYLPPGTLENPSKALNSTPPLADKSLPLSEYDHEILASAFHEIVSAHMPPNAALAPEQIASADARVREELPKFIKDELRHWRLSLWSAARNLAAATAIVQFISILIFGITIGQRIFGFAVVNKQGERAGRLRMLGRWFVIWTPFFLVITKLDIFANGQKAMSTDLIIKCSLWGILWLVCVIVAITRPERGFHDEQAGTWIVPR